MTTKQAGPVEYLEAYGVLRERLGNIIGANDGDVPVPACPGWPVRDVVAHLAGLCEDWVNHRLDGYASGSWTANHVARYPGCTCAVILQMWAHTMKAFADLGDDPEMSPPARWAFGDAVVHEADIRGSLSAGRDPRDAVLLGLEGAIMRWRKEVLRSSGVPTLRLRSPDARD